MLGQLKANAFDALLNNAQTQRRYKEISHIILRRSLKKYLK